mgnify:CR=1 FL=1
MKKNLHNSKGFTIVETLVAIAILMISIAGPLTIAQKGLMASVYARDQSVATFLAQDAMEYAKNYRDNQIKSNPSDWLGILANCGLGSGGSDCTVDTTDEGSITAGGSPILYRTDYGYNHDSSGAKSQFSRTLSVSETDEDYQVRVVVEVEWTTGTIHNVVTLENYFFNVTI